MALRKILRVSLVGAGASWVAASRGFSAASVASASSPVPLSRVGVCQFAVTADKASNIATATRLIRSAADKGARLVVLPEVWNGPYATSAFQEYAEVCPGVGDDATRSASPSVCALAKLASELKLCIVAGSIAELDADGKLYNTCLVYNSEGAVIAKFPTSA
ncbi:carbon-nitrogen hydrolase [Pavlovales sp. CCMP2436]|nr:carbon-nitrogen hydrolase [Pavlovales sp. CCMP2436]